MYRRQLPKAIRGVRRQLPTAPSPQSPRVRCPQPRPRPTSHVPDGDAGAAETVSAALLHRTRLSSPAGSLPTPPQTARRSLRRAVWRAPKGHSTSCPPHRSHACTRTTSLHLPFSTRLLHLVASARMLCTSGIRHSSCRAVRHTYNITHCCLHRSVGAKVPPPANCPRACVYTLPRLRRRHRSNRSQQSHARAVRRSLCHTQHPTPSFSSSRLHHRGCAHTPSQATLPRLPLARTGHPPMYPVPCVLVCRPRLLSANMPVVSSHSSLPPFAITGRRINVNAVQRILHSPPRQPGRRRVRRAVHECTLLQIEQRADGTNALLLYDRHGLRMVTTGHVL